MPNFKSLKQLTKILKELPMDEASRMARAKEMGFDVNRRLYHATPYVFDEFKPSKQGLFGEAVYTSEVPNWAEGWVNPYNSRFIENQNTIPLYSRAKIFDLDDPKHQEMLKNKYGESWKDYTPEEFAHSAKEFGFDAIRHAGNVAFFDPKLLRSKFAKFDPTKKDSANLSAGLGAATTGGLAAKQALQSERPETEEERWSKIQSLLKK